MDLDTLEQLPNGIIIYSAEDEAKLLYANTAALKICECESFEEMLTVSGGNYLNFFRPEDYGHHRPTIQLAWDSDQNFEHHAQYRIITGRHHVRLLNDEGRVIQIPGYRKCYLCSITLLDRQINYALDTTDRLTGLLGLGQFIQYSESFLKTAAAESDSGSYQLAYFNIRRFKNYNVEYGSAKGDQVLRDLAKIILDWSATKIVTRISADQFAAISKVRERNEHIHHMVEEFLFEYGASGLSLDVGLYPIPDWSQDIHTACDLAKIACDSIRHAAEHICIYTEELSRTTYQNSYIIGHLDQAIAGEYLKVNYQPIFRTMTGEMCGLEAVVRWDDPELGYLRPSDFIPALEESHQVKKLDLYVLEQVSRRLSEMSESEAPMLPVSLNLSYLDFIDAEMFHEVEAIASLYSVPRDMLHIEINEFVLVNDTEIFRHEIERFRQGGYQIWMDDFGSRYSALSHLKEYQLDAIKLDMNLLDSRDDTSRAVLRSTIQLAKRLNVQTIAKHVETKEQFAFLREAGCEKQQGLYFCEPGTSDTIQTFIETNHITCEARSDRRYYDQIGRIDLMTDRAIAIVEYDQKSFRLLYINEEFKQIGREIGLERDDFMEYIINDFSSTLSRKFRYFQDHTRLGEEYAQMDFSIYGQYFRLKSRRISENLPYVANQIELINLTKEEDVGKNQRLDHLFRMMYSMYDTIFLLRNDGKFENIMRSLPGETDDLKRLEEEKIIVTVDRILQELHPKDRAGFTSFTEVNSLKERLKHTERGYEIRYFRSKDRVKDYVWKIYILQYIPEMDQVLFSTLPAPSFEKGLLKTLAANYLADSTYQFEYHLGKMMQESDAIGLYWKDRSRRFLGANAKCLRLFGIRDESELIGREVEDFPWLSVNDAARHEEKRVLEDGVSLINMLQKCIINGEAHTVLVSEEPMLQNGKVVGILGSVIDIDPLVQDEISQSNTRDALTGLVSANGMLNFISEYAEGWNSRKENFAAIRIEFREQRQNYKEYGHAISNQIAKKAADTLKEVCRNRAVIARLYAGNYSILMRCSTRDAAEALTEEIRTRMSEIHEVDGYDVTFYPQFQIYLADQTEHMSELIAVVTGGTADDLMVRQRLEDKLNDYNLQLETVVDAIPGGIAMYEIIGDEIQMIYASSGVGAVAGKTQEEFMDEALHEQGLSVHHKDIELLRQATMQAVAANEEVNVTYRLLHQNGNIIWVNMRGRVVGTQNGHPLLLVVFRNLSETTVIYESALDEAFASVIVSADADGEILYANHSAKETGRQLIDGSVHDFYQTILSQCTESRITENERNTSENCQYEIELNNRNLLVYFVSGTWNGRSAHICYVSDITAKYIEEREKAERESLLYLQAINASYDMLVTFNLTRDQYQMRQGRNFLGFDWSHYRKYSDLISEVRTNVPEEDRDTIGYYEPDRQIDEFMHGTSYVDYEHRIYDSNGQLHWTSDRFVYAKDPVNGDILGISLSMLIDDRVKARNEQKEQLQKALDDAVEANRAKSQFLSNMSHDIRTPMNAIMGYSSIAVDHISESARVEDCLKKILISGNHLQELINDVLDMSRIESGKEVLNPTDGSWTEIIDDIKAIANPLATAKHIQLIVEADGIEHRLIRADLSKIKRIMINVLGNAIKFTKENGRVCCSVTELPMCRLGCGRYQIRVEDNGIGMSKGFQQHIFEAFSREKTSTESKETGTGLGMAITKRYIDLMGGSIDVDSTEGQGTIVTLQVELQYLSETKRHEEKPEEKQTVSLRGKHALVVDDSALNRDIEQLFLEDIGITSDCAETGLAAVRMLESCEDGTYDFVLMDVRMPELNGIEATKLLRASYRKYLREVPIIAVTADAFTEDNDACIRAGMNGYLAKPFRMEHLVRLLEDKL